MSCTSDQCWVGGLPSSNNIVKLPISINNESSNAPYDAKIKRMESHSFQLLRLIDGIRSRKTEANKQLELKAGLYSGG